MATIGIVEDEINVAKTLKLVVESFGYEVAFISGKSNVAIELANQHSPDLLLIDIQLKGGGSGIDVANAIGQSIPFIFLTSQTSAEIIKDAASTSPISYILKPFRREEIFAALQIALNASKKNDANMLKSVFVKEGTRMVKIDFDDILYINSDHIYIEIHRTNSKKIVVRSSLNAFLKQLPQEMFLRIHLRYVVNKLYIVAIGKKEVQLTNGIHLPISRSYLKSIDIP